MPEYDGRPKPGFIARMPVWLKACLVKWWFGGAIFYFIGFTILNSGSIPEGSGRAVDYSNLVVLDQIVALGLVLGIINDLIINRILVFFESDKVNYRAFMFSYSKRFISVPINLVYGVALSFIIANTYELINVTAVRIGNLEESTVFIGAEPILYGLFFMGWDMLFIFLKRILTKFIKNKLHKG
ncbi:MAG: hypothetical protein LBR85_08255 [Oscillospiraceae bacterium]|nr:hypothetical protein [Oscillospiraceae bacterium]